MNPTVYPYTTSSGKALIASALNRMAMDVAAFDIQHVRLDTETNRYKETINSGLNQCLTLEANIDQSGRAFIQDAVMSMFDEGHVVLVPVDTTQDPTLTTAFDVNSLRTGKVVEWFPKHVRVDVYNDTIGIREQIILPKNMVGIVQNPLYAIMNEPNSTLQRLLHKLRLLDSMDNQASTGKLDLIIQLPYVIKSESKQKQAEERRKAMEQQLSSSKYGVAYADGTEKVVQLNRAVENTLLPQIEYLTKMLFNQLGIAEGVLNGSGDEKVMRNYYDRTIEPIATALTDELSRKFITKTGRSQGQTIMGFRDVLRLIPLNELGEFADSLVRNEILSPNEVRAIIGMKPSDNPASDELRNPNMPMEMQGDVATETEQTDPGLPRETVQQMLDDMSQEYQTTIDDLLDAVKKSVDEQLSAEEITELENKAEEAGGNSK